MRVRFMGNYPMKNEPIEVTIQVTQVFEKPNLPYRIGGSLASTLYDMAE